MASPNNTIPPQINALAGVLEERARFLRDYARMVADDETLLERLGDEHAGAVSVNQIISEVEGRTKSLDLWPLRHTTLAALVNAQRGTQ